MYVYIIKQGDFFKIGKTYNLQSRLAGLQTATPEKIKIVAYVETDELCALEKELHKEMKPFHSHGEWFKFDSEVLERIMAKHDFNLFEKAWRNKKDVELIGSLKSAQYQNEILIRTLKKELQEKTEKIAQLDKSLLTEIAAKKDALHWKDAFFKAAKGHKEKAEKIESEKGEIEVVHAEYLYNANWAFIGADIIISMLCAFIATIFCFYGYEYKFIICAFSMFTLLPLAIAAKRYFIVSEWYIKRLHSAAIKHYGSVRDYFKVKGVDLDTNKIDRKVNKEWVQKQGIYQ